MASLGREEDVHRHLHCLEPRLDGLAVELVAGINAGDLAVAGPLSDLAVAGRLLLYLLHVALVVDVVVALLHILISRHRLLLPPIPLAAAEEGQD